VDLSKLIPLDNNSSSYLRIVETGGHSYVVVTGSTALEGNYAYFYDLDLNLKLPLSKTSAPTGTGVMVDSNGNIALGGSIYSAADLSLIGLNPVSAIVYTQGNSGIDGIVGNSSNAIGFYCPGGSSTFSYTVYTGWAPPPTQFTPILSSSMSNLRINALLDDGNSTGNLILVISQSSNNNNNNTATCYFVTIAKSAITVAAPVANYLLDAAPHRDNLDTESFGFANGSVFAYDASSSSYVRINPADGSIQNSYYSGTKTEQPRFAYRADGGSFYGFDKKSRILTKYTAWW
jgi:hypothetical protein